MNHLNRREPQIRRDQGEGPGVAASARAVRCVVDPEPRAVEADEPLLRPDPEETVAGLKDGVDGALGEAVLGQHGGPHSESLFVNGYPGGPPGATLQE